jgi:hypothetical protein
MVAGTPGAAPTVPTAPTITGITPGDAQLSVAFTAPTSDGGSAVTDYQYSTDNGASFTSTASTVSPLVITGLTNGTEYEVIIQATNSVGNSPNSNMVAGTPGAAPTVPTAPAITGITPGDSQLSVAFTAPTSDGGSAVTDYQYSTDNGASFTSAASTVSPLVITGLTNGTEYEVIIQATNSVGNSPNSNMVAGTPGAAPTVPTAPTIDSITPGDTQLSVVFTAPTSDGGSAITDYQYSTDNGASFTSAASTDSPLVLTGLTNDTEYSVIIQATNSVGNSANSNMVTGTPVAV